MPQEMGKSQESSSAGNSVFSSRLMDESAIHRLIDLLSRERTVYVPQGNSFKVWDGSFSPGERKVLFGPKKIFFGQKQKVFSFDSDGNVKDALEHTMSAVFGLRACDLNGILMMDRYLGENGEPFYLSARENTVIIGMTCEEADDGCFCTQFGGVFPNKGGYDLWLTHTGDSFVVDVGSEEGKRLMDALEVPYAGEDDIAAKKKEIEWVEGSIDWEPLPEDEIINAMLNGISNPLWDDLTERCLACGKCNMVCPTCHCYDITDEVGLDGKGERIRVWDACHLFRYGMVAGGHNFRGERRARVQYRVYDKFYYPYERYGVFACTGCGRCLEACNANIDLRDILTRICQGGST